MSHDEPVLPPHTMMNRAQSVETFLDGVTLALAVVRLPETTLGNRDEKNRAKIDSSQGGGLAGPPDVM